MTTSYSIVSKHEGLIEVESEWRHGSTFRVYLPASAVQEGPPGEDAKTEANRSYQGRGRILVMDDEQFMLDILALQLRAMGYECVTTADGDSTLILVREALVNQQKI